MTATRPPMLAADHIRELTQPYVTRETVTQPTQRNGAWADETRIHTVHHPSLLNQLRAAGNGSTNLSDTDAARSAAGSKPAAHLEALDVLARIDRQSRNLAATLEAGEHHNLELRLLAISGKVGSEIHPRIRSWWATARLTTHHDTPPMRPHGVPCLNCWELDSLRIRPEDEMGSCTKCGEVWDRTGEAGHGSLMTLAEHVRWCSDHEITKARHWTTDDEGYPVECTTCLVYREDYASRRHAKPEQVDNMTHFAS